MKASIGGLLIVFTLLLTLAFMCKKSKASTEEMTLIIESLAKVDQGILNLLSSKDNQFSNSEATQLDDLKESIILSNYKVAKMIFDRHSKSEIAKLDSNTIYKFWLIVQHSDHDVSFQRSFLDFLNSIIASGKVNNGDIAYLTDRVLINEGKPQRYGTQIVYSEKNIAVAKDLEDLNKVEDLRRNMGLEPLQQYLDFMTRLKLPKDSLFTFTIKRQ